MRRKLPGSVPFLNDLAKKVGTTGQRPHICNAVKRRVLRGQVITPWLVTLAARPRCLVGKGSRNQSATSRGLVD